MHDTSRHGGGGLEPKDASNIIKVLSSNPIRSRLRLHQSASPSEPVAVSVAIAAALIEAALRRDDAVYLHLGGSRATQLVDNDSALLIRLRAKAEYFLLISERRSKASNQAKEPLSEQSDNLMT